MRQPIDCEFDVGFVIMAKSAFEAKTSRDEVVKSVYVYIGI